MARMGRSLIHSDWWIVGGLGEAAGVHDAEDGGDGRPFKALGFAAVIEAGPDETAGYERTFGDEFPALAMGLAPAGAFVVVGGDDVAGIIVGEFAARHEGGGVFGAGDGNEGIFFVEAVVDVIVVVEAHDIDGLEDAFGVVHAAVHGGGDGAGGVETFHLGGEAADHLAALRGALHGFLVEDGPEDDARVVAVAFQQHAQLVEVFGGVVKIAVLVHDEETLAIAGFEELSGGRVVGGAIGVGAEFF